MAARFYIPPLWAKVSSPVLGWALTLYGGISASSESGKLDRILAACLPATLHFPESQCWCTATEVALGWVLHFKTFADACLPVAFGHGEFWDPVPLTALLRSVSGVFDRQDQAPQDLVPPMNETTKPTSCSSYF